jgi:DDE superfamily endonuclease
MGAVLATELTAVGVRERLVAFVEEVSEGLGHPRRRENALLYVRGLVERGAARACSRRCFASARTAGVTGRCGSFWVDSRWDSALLIGACAERVVPGLGLVAWVVDDTGVKKDGEHSPGVKRQWSGTRGKIDNCQVTVSVHAGGERGSLPLGWALDLLEEWCADLPRRRKAKVPDAVSFQTKRGLGLRPLRAGGRGGDPDGSDPGRLRLRRRQRLPLWSCTGRNSSTCSLSPPRSASTGRRRASRCRSGTARPAARGLSPAPIASPSRCVRSRSGCRARRSRRSSVARRPRARRSRAASPSSASSPPIRPHQQPAAPDRVADQRMA